MEYKDVIPIRLRPSLCWLVEFNDKKKYILITSTSFSIEEIVSYIKVHYGVNKKFTVQQIDVGEFQISDFKDLYSSDGRKVDNNLNIVV